MKLSVTVNLGNYENIRIESSEYEMMTQCMEEIDTALKYIRVPQVEDFRDRIFGNR